MTVSDFQSDPRLIVHAYLDGELDLANTLAAEKLIAAERELAAEYQMVNALKARLRAPSLRKTSPAGLRRRVERAVGIRRAPARPSWLAYAASLAMAVMISGSSGFMLRTADKINRTQDNVVAAHMRSLMAPQAIDVASSDRHTVKPWFNGRVPTAPRVVDLARNDFPLIGGRVDVVDQVAVPTLVYRHRNHLISLTTVAARDPAAAPVATATQGYNMIHWIENGSAFWAISDLDTADLENFVELFRANPAE